MVCSRMSTNPDPTTALQDYTITEEEAAKWRLDRDVFGNACLLIIDGQATHVDLRDVKLSGWPDSGKLLITHG